MYNNYNSLTTDSNLFKDEKAIVILMLLINRGYNNIDVKSLIINCYLKGGISLDEERELLDIFLASGEIDKIIYTNIELVEILDNLKARDKLTDLDYILFLRIFKNKRIISSKLYRSLIITKSLDIKELSTKAMELDIKRELLKAII